MLEIVKMKMMLGCCSGSGLELIPLVFLKWLHTFRMRKLCYIYFIVTVLPVLLKPKSNCESVLQIKYLTPKTAILYALPIKGGCALNNFLNLYFCMYYFL